MPRPQQAEERKAPPAADAKKGEENAKLGSLRQRVVPFRLGQEIKKDNTKPLLLISLIFNSTGIIIWFKPASAHPRTFYLL